MPAYLMKADTNAQYARCIGFFPRTTRFAHGAISFFESSVDEAIVRMLGLMAVAIGIAMIYFGIYVV